MICRILRVALLTLIYATLLVISEASAQSVDTKLVPKFTLETLQQDFLMSEVLRIIKESRDRRSSQKYLESQQGRLKFQASQRQAPMVIDGYTVLEVVDDVEAARQALGYGQINLESRSYGTRLAQIYTWRYPDQVHRNAMVAVNPPGRFWWDGAILQEQILLYSAL